MSKLLAMMMKPKEYMYATIKGSLTENNGVFSNFSNSSYLELQQPFILNADTVAEIVIKVNIPTRKTNNAFFATDISRGIYINITGTDLIQLYVGNGTDWVINQLNGTHSLSANTNYYIKINFNNNVVTISISTDNVNWIQDIQANMNLDTTTNYIIKLGARSSTQYFNGSIDLNQSYIKINNTKYQLQAVVGYTVVGNPTIVDGVVSGFSFTGYNSGNYLQINNGQINFSTDDFKIKLCASKINTVSSQETLIATTYSFPIGIYVFSNRVELRLYTSNNTLIQKLIEYDIPSNTKFYISLEKKGNNFIFGVSLDNINFTYNNFVQADIQAGNKTISIGHDYYRACPNCAIYLNETIIYKNNKLWFNGQPA